MTSRMFADLPGASVKKARKRRRRLQFGQKVTHVVHMMTENARQLCALTGCEGWGFKMSQIAQMTGYERSTALLNDLLKMCDEGHIMLEVKPLLTSGVSSVEYWFYTHEEHKRALKLGRLIS